jgi:hypothetical protein
MVIDPAVKPHGPPIKIYPEKVHVVTRVVVLPIVQRVVIEGEARIRPVKGHYKMVPATCKVKAFNGAHASALADGLAYGRRDEAFNAGYGGTQSRPWNPGNAKGPGVITWIEDPADDDEHLELS